MDKYIKVFSCFDHSPDMYILHNNQKRIIYFNQTYYDFIFNRFNIKIELNKTYDEIFTMFKNGAKKANEYLNTVLQTGESIYVQDEYGSSDGYNHSHLYKTYYFPLKQDAQVASSDHDTGSLKCIKLKDFKKNVNKQKNLMYEIGT